MQRLHLTPTMTSEVFLAQFRTWITDPRRQASHGTCLVARARWLLAGDLWIWTLEYLLHSIDAEGQKLYQPNGRA